MHGNSEGVHGNPGGGICITTHFKRVGYKRYIARTKSPLSEANCRTRKDWAEKHLNWTREQWFTILWTDKTWVNGGRYTKTWVTRLPNEALDSTCVVDKVSKPKG